MGVRIMSVRDREQLFPICYDCRVYGYDLHCRWSLRIEMISVKQRCSYLSMYIPACAWPVYLRACSAGTKYFTINSFKSRMKMTLYAQLSSHPTGAYCGEKNACTFIRAHIYTHIDGLVQNCSNSIANALELLQYCTKPSISSKHHSKSWQWHWQWCIFTTKWYTIHAQ